MYALHVCMCARARAYVCKCVCVCARALVRGGERTLPSKFDGTKKNQDRVALVDGIILTMSIPRVGPLKALLNDRLSE